MARVASIKTLRNPPHSYEGTASIVHSSHFLLFLSPLLQQRYSHRENAPFPGTPTFPENCAVQNSVRGGNSSELKCGSLDRAISNWMARERSKQWLRLGIFPGNKRKRKEKKVRESRKCERKRKES